MLLATLLVFPARIVFGRALPVWYATLCPAGPTGPSAMLRTATLVKLRLVRGYHLNPTRVSVSGDCLHLKVPLVPRLRRILEAISAPGRVVIATAVRPLSPATALAIILGERKRAVHRRAPALSVIVNSGQIVATIVQLQHTGWRGFHLLLSIDRGGIRKLCHYTRAHLRTLLYVVVDGRVAADSLIMQPICSNPVEVTFPARSGAGVDPRAMTVDLRFGPLPVRLRVLLLSRHSRSAV